MDEKKLKLFVSVAVVLFLIYLCLPLENGNSEGALLRNHVRREKVFPWNVELIHVEDLSLQDEQEQMRAAIFKEKENYTLQWYQMDEEGNYKIYKNAITHWNDFDQVIMFPDLHIDFYELEYEVYFSEDERTDHITVYYDYKIKDGKEIIEEGVLKESYPVERNPQLLCIPYNKFDDKGGNGRSIFRTVSAKDADGNIVFDTLHGWIIEE